MAIKTGTAAADVLNSGAASDRLNGLGGDDTLNGGGGKDTLVGGSGSNWLSGGSGNDVYIFNSAPDRITEAPGGGTDTVLSFVKYALPANVEKLILEGSKNIAGTGNAADNQLTGNFGNNRLRGLGGDDRLDGGDG